MAVEILLLNQDGAAGRKKGATINIKEAPDDEDIGWCRGERPPTFRVLRVEGILKDDLDPEWLEFGGHRSKTLVDETKLNSAEIADLDDDDTYATGKGKDGKPKKSKKAKRKFSYGRLKQLAKDNTADWDAART